MEELKQELEARIELKEIKECLRPLCFWVLEKLTSKPPVGVADGVRERGARDEGRGARGEG